MRDDPQARLSNLSRRTFLSTAGSSAAAAAIAGCAPTSNRTAARGSPEAVAEGPNIEGAVPVTLRINGKEQRLLVDPRTTLLDCVRETVALTGTKKGCDHGQCGACTVLLDGRRINACLTLAVMHDGQSIETIEGLAAGEALHPMQAAFIEHDGFQCGYCTSGQICSAVGMLRESRAGMPSYATEDLAQPQPELTDVEIRERMSGNICRCAGYPNIVAAIRQAAAQRT